MTAQTISFDLSHQYDDDDQHSLHEASIHSLLDGDEFDSPSAGRPKRKSCPGNFMMPDADSLKENSPFDWAKGFGQTDSAKSRKIFPMPPMALARRQSMPAISLKHLAAVRLEQLLASRPSSRSGSPRSARPSLRRRSNSASLLATPKSPRSPAARTSRNSTPGTLRSALATSRSSSPSTPTTSRKSIKSVRFSFVEPADEKASEEEEEEWEEEGYEHESYQQDPWSMADQTEQAFFEWAQAQAWADAEAQAQAMAAQQAQAEAYAYAAAAQQFYAPPTPFAQPAYPQPFVPMAPPMAPAMPMMPMGMEQWAMPAEQLAYPPQPQPQPQYQQQAWAQPPSPPSPPQQPSLAAARPGSLVALAKEKEGSRKLQERLVRMSDAQVSAACDELAPHLLELATHSYGNYAVSKLASMPQAQPHLVAALRGHVVSLLCHPQGSRVVQAVVSALPPADAASLVGELDGRVLECALNTNGSWGVCVAFEKTRAPFVLEQVAAQLYALSTSQHGVRVVQRVVKAAAAARMELAAIGEATASGGDVAQLAAHQFGNYAVQVALRHCAPAQRARLLDALLPHTLALSTSKHGSNVAEQLLTLATDMQLAPVCETIFGAAAEGRNGALRQLMSNEFGNYVLQTLLRRLEPAARANALRLVEGNVTPTNFGRTILSASR